MVEKEDKTTNIRLEAIPVVAIREVVVFPAMIAPILVSREKSINALEESMRNESNLIVLLAQKDPVLDKPEITDLFKVGVLARVIQVLKFPDGSVKAIIEGVKRVRVKSIDEVESVYYSNCSNFKEISEGNENTKALVRIVIDKFENYVRKNSRMTPENLMALASISQEPGRLADIIATYLEIEISERQKILEAKNTSKRLEMMNALLEREMKLLDIEEGINKKLKDNISNTQKEFYLREKLKVIKEELNGKNNVENELDLYREKINTLDIPEKYKNKIFKEVDRVEKMPDYSMEVSLVRTYLDRVIALPWNERTKDLKDLTFAKQVLDEDHWGLDEIKERILEFLAVKQLSDKPQTTILCLVGPPGVGKTSLAKSIARSLDRKFSYISLGGINDESEIRGHRRTYIGSMPGRIIQAIEHAETRNPVILLDELEKMMRSHMGDPTAALLEVLDPEQNVNFTDHYIDIPFDLSDVMFIATANSIDTVYKALKDRLEVIKLSGYTEEEKLNIAKYFLVDKQLDKHGIVKSRLKISDIAIRRIINEYTKEAGVRNLERFIAKICRKVATLIVRNEESKVSISNKNLEEYLGVPLFNTEDKRKENEIGIINGLAWTEYGGDILNIEANIMPGKGDLQLTGSLGDVMQESAKAALSFIRSNSKKYNIISNIKDKYDVHVHVPDGATPKDGPSAGLAITLAMISALTGKPINADVALTGEVTLRGKVLPVGGLKEKVLAAMRNDIYKIIVPDKNKKNISELPDYIKDKVEFIYVNNVDQALEHFIAQI